MTKTAAKEKETKNEGLKKNELYINRLKINNDGLAEIFYRTSTDSAAQEVYYKGKDPVTEEFKNLFQSSVDSLTEIIQRLRPDKNDITMNVIKFDYDSNGFLKSALYSAKYKFNSESNAVINLNTPPLPIYKEELEKTFCISGKDVDLLHEIIAKAKAYIKGDTRTKQMKIVVDNT